jgi:TRAP-type C4-dicarboxylate transport system permease small subunit
MRRIIDKILGIIIVSMLAILVLACLWQIFSRFALNSPSKYTEELMRYGLVWLSLLGAPYAYGRGKHAAMTFLLKKIPNAGQRYMDTLVDLLVAAFAVIVLIIGGIIVGRNAAGQISSSLSVPMPVFYLFAPVSGLLFLFYVAANIKERFSVNKAA